MGTHSSPHAWDEHKFRRSPHSLLNKASRQLWNIAYLLLFRPSPQILHGWRRFLLRCFGARVGHGVRLFSSVKIWAPWNLELGERCSLGDGVDCYCVERISVGAFATISQGSRLCGATHDWTQLHLPLVTGGITIGRHVWLCAETFVMPNVSVGDGAVIGVRSTVFKDIPAWQVAVGTPCKVVKPRHVVDSGATVRQPAA
jgi:putative colanic acid biosynthesis acetyltransferase WcaF